MDRVRGGRGDASGRQHQDIPVYKRPCVCVYTRAALPYSSIDNIVKAGEKKLAAVWMRYRDKGE